MSTFLFGLLGFPGHLELIVVGVVVLLLFGHRLPGLMRSMGASVTEFKKGLNDDGDKELDGKEDKAS